MVNKSFYNINIAQLKSVVLFFFIIFQGFAVFSQRPKQEEFTEKNFLVEFEILYKQDRTVGKDHEKQYDALYKEYQSLWNQLPFNTKDKVAEISNRLIKLKAPIYPAFYNFLNAQLGVFKKFQSTQQVYEWVLCTEVVLDEKRRLKDFNDFIATTSLLIDKNFLYESRTSIWEFPPSTDFSFKAQNKNVEIIFKTPFDLVYNSQGDANVIYRTTGSYYPLDTKWEGKGGRIDWGRTGISEAKCFADLGKYEAITKFPKFTADSVRFIHTDYFKEPMLGKVEDQLSGRMEPGKYTYPRFRSYTKEFVIKNLFPDVNYQGSFMMNGGKFLTSGVDGMTSTIIFYRQGNPFLYVESPSFLIDSDKLSSKSASIIIILGEDSITNVGVDVNYRSANREVRIQNDKNRNFNSPYEDSYHKIDIYCENIIWRMDEDKIYLSNTGQLNTVNSIQLESSNYFSGHRYHTIQGVETISPLQRVAQYSNSRKTREFYIDEFARYIRMDVLQAKTMIHTLSRYGLVAFDANENRVYVKEKLFNYTRSQARAIDYDVINISSEVSSGENAFIDLKNNDLSVNGVRGINVSDTQNVVIRPEKGNIIMKKNRDMIFSGRITVGQFELYITDCSFNYDDFKLELPRVDSLSFYTSSFTDDQMLMRVQTKINDLKGEIFIDQPGNKAGLKDSKDYPIFNSLDNSYAYYESSNIRNGVYTKDRFFYKLDPFTIKNMMKIKPDNLVFTGSLNSAGIFPEIKEPLKVQPDYSLGFITQTGDKGLPAYGGKGTYYNEIDLSNKGLIGRGKITYLSAELQSKDIVFMPDSTHITTDTFFVKPQPTFADANVGRSFGRWYPYQDMMDIHSAKDPIRMYKNEALLSGRLRLEPKGMSGKGNVNIRELDLSSELFAFNQDDLSSDNTGLKLHSGTNLAFQTQGVKSNVNFKTRMGEFLSDELSRAELPIIQYAAYIDKFTWFMDKHEIALSSSKNESDAQVANKDLRKLVDMEMPGALFVSTHPQQGGLEFNAIHALLKYREDVLMPEKVYTIRVADALIAPGDNKFNIYAGAKMDTIHNSKILADTLNRYHEFYDATVVINSKKSFVATGYADYVDENEKKQKVYLTEITPNVSAVTIANGVIPEEDRFMLSPAFGFKGNVTISPEDPFYTFKGGVQLQHQCKAAGETLPYTRFNGKINPKEIHIPIEEIPADIDGQRITASILFNKTDLSPYAAFLTNDKAVDNEFLSAHGFLTYDKTKKMYKIGSMEKLADPDEATGNYLTMDKDNCNVFGEGRIKFDVNQELVSLMGYGQIETNNTKTEAKMNTVFGFSFPFLQQALDMMGAYIFDDLSPSPADLNDENIRKALCEYLGVDEGNMTYNEFLGYGEFDKIPKDFNHTLLFNNLKLNYSPELGYHFNGMASLGKVGKYQVNKLIRTRVQFAKIRNSIFLKILLEITPEHWYYFSCEFPNSQTQPQRMRVSSNIEEFEALIKNASNRSTKAKSGKTFTYGLTVSKTEVANFKRTMEGMTTDEDYFDEEDVTDEDEIIEEVE